MSAGITVEDFKYIRGVNDSEYIELLKNAYERQKRITSKAIAKLKEQPERNKGEWLFNVRGCHGYTCPYCGIHKAFKHNFCPNCGADMRGETDEQ